VPGGGGTPYNGLYGKASPERGTFFWVRYMKGYGAEVYKRVSVYKKAQKGCITDAFYGCEKVEKTVRAYFSVRVLPIN